VPVWEHDLDRGLRRRDPRHHQPPRPAAAAAPPRRPGRRGHRRHRRLQPRPLPGLLLLRPGQDVRTAHGLRPRP
jgi:hypothetical protein